MARRDEAIEHNGPASEKSSDAAMWVFIPAMLLVLYPLSIGPVVWLSVQGLLPSWLEESLEVIYQPVIYATEEFEVVGMAFYWYLGLWIDLF